MKLCDAESPEQALICWYQERIAAMEAAEARYRAAVATIQKLSREMKRDKEQQTWK